jgi:hypothetical protein
MAFAGGASDGPGYGVDVYNTTLLSCVIDADVNGTLYDKPICCHVVLLATVIEMMYAVDASIVTRIVYHVPAFKAVGFVTDPIAAIPGNHPEQTNFRVLA